MVCLFGGDFPRTDLGPNIDPFPVQIEQKPLKIAYFIHNVLALQFGENFMKIKQK